MLLFLSISDGWVVANIIFVCPAKIQGQRSGNDIGETRQV